MTGRSTKADRECVYLVMVVDAFCWGFCTEEVRYFYARLSFLFLHRTKNLGERYAAEKIRLAPGCQLDVLQVTAPVGRAGYCG